MKILITGSSGYVGYVLSKYFSEKKTKVIGLSTRKNHFWNGNKYFKFYNCDVLDRRKLEFIFMKEKPSHVIHLAYLMNPLHDRKTEDLIDINGSKNVIQIANKIKSVKQFIKFSSTSAYGAWPNNKLWIKETQKLRPRDYVYGINKKKVEGYYNKFKKRKDMKLVIVRMCTAIGPLYFKKGGVVSLLVKSPFLLKINNKSCELQFIHEDDLKNLVNLIVNDKKVEGTYNLCPDSYATTKKLAPNKIFLPVPLWLMRFAAQILWKLRITSMGKPAMTLSTYGIVADPSKLMKRYNYKFNYSTLEAFKDTVKKRKANETL